MKTQTLLSVSAAVLAKTANSAALDPTGNPRPMTPSVETSAAVHMIGTYTPTETHLVGGYSSTPDNAQMTARAPITTAGPSESRHHYKFEVFDSPTCTKEHVSAKLSLNIAGDCEKLPASMQHIRSIKLLGAARTWACTASLYADQYCSQTIAGIGYMDVHEQDSCYAWKGQGQGSEIQAGSARMFCAAPEEFNSTYGSADEHHPELGQVNIARNAVSSAAAPAASAGGHDDDSKSKHHVKFTGFDGDQCDKEHDKKDFELNVDGDCKELSKMHYRSLKVKKASRTWECDVKYYSDKLCKNKIGDMPNIDTDENDSCWAWTGNMTGAEIEAQSARMSCDHPDEADHTTSDEHHPEADGDDDN